MARGVVDALAGLEQRPGTGHADQHPDRAHRLGHAARDPLGGAGDRPHDEALVRHLEEPDPTPTTTSAPTHGHHGPSRRSAG